MFSLMFIPVLWAAVAQTVDFDVATAAPHNRRVKMALRIPAGFSPKTAPECRIMVLFGGRNWPGAATLKRYDFAELADKFRLFLLAPGFVDDEYWYPQKWSGPALLQAIKMINIKYGLNENRKIIYLGYSAGGQCAVLFYHWKPEIVKMWGVYACGVWFEPEPCVSRAAPAIITCGEYDRERYSASERFVRRARECGYSIVWRSYPADHGLSSEALALAGSFFAALLAGKFTAAYIGDDQEMNFYPAGSRDARNIEVEYRNRLPSRDFAEQWNR
ncbi:MAG: hypothetical protein PHH77_09560 [Victivallaceae bacterium]|nr:hypothetical protein [Victivallaceae bacterium]